MEAEKDKGIIYYIVWYSGDHVHAIDKMPPHANSNEENSEFQHCRVKRLYRFEHVIPLIRRGKEGFLLLGCSVKLKRLNKLSRWNNHWLTKNDMSFSFWWWELTWAHMNGAEIPCAKPVSSEEKPSKNYISLISC